MMVRTLLTAAMLALTLPGRTQTGIPVNSWRTHLSYNSLVALASSNTDIYAANRNGLFAYRPGSGEITTLSKLTGLTGTGITALGYHPSTSTLVIAYEDGNIDLWQDNRLSNFPWLKLADIEPSKEVYHIYSTGGYAYLSCAFGILVIDLEQQLVRDTYFELGPAGEKIAVYSTLVANDSLYMATEAGIARGSLQDNLKDFRQWRWYSGSELPAGPARVILAIGSELLTAVDTAGLFRFNGNAWENTNLLQGRLFRQGHATSNQALITTTDSVFLVTGNTAAPITSGLISAPQAALYSGGEIWVADSLAGLVRTATSEAIYPNGPLSNDIALLYGYANRIVALPPAYDAAFRPLRSRYGFFMFAEGEWTNYSEAALPGTNPLPEFYDITGAARLPADGHLYLSSFGYGLLQVRDDGFTVFDENSPGSTLTNLNPPGRNVWVSALAASGNRLHLINFSASRGLHNLSPAENTWQGYATQPSLAYGLQIVPVDENIVWVRIAPGLGGGIAVIDLATGREKMLNTATGGLPDNRVYDLATDREGRMWVATAKGVVYYYLPAYVLDESDPRPAVPVYDNRPLFEDQPVTALAADAGGRMWMGTRSGLWLLAADGRELIWHFTTDNSPLPDNDIRDIAINHRTGEVFVATANGLVSYRSTAADNPLPEVRIFPNPLVAGRDDTVTIEGVPYDAEVWITDSSGRLVFKTRALGTTAVWSGIGSGSGLSPGVYWVFAAGPDGGSRRVGKLAIVF